MSTTEFVPAHDPELRKSGIGGSDAPKVLDISRWGGPLDVYLEKRGLAESKPAGEAAKWGSILEPAILQEYAQVIQRPVLGRIIVAPTVFLPSGRTVDATNLDSAAWLGTLRHPDREWQMAHIDAFVIDDNGDIVSPVEVKTSSRVGDWGEPGTDDIPPDHLVQVTHYADVLEGLEMPVTVFPVVALLVGQRFQPYAVPVDADLTSLIDTREAQLWTRIVNGDPPPATTPQQLRQLWPKASEREVVAPPGSPLDAAMWSLYAAQLARKEAEKNEDAAKVAVQENLTDAQIGTGEQWKVTWRNNKDSETTDWKAAFTDLRNVIALVENDLQRGILGANEIEQIIARYTETKPGARVLRPNWKL